MKRETLKGYTASDMADILGINLKAAKLRLFRAGIKPMTTEALYDPSALEILRNTGGKGRPKKEMEAPEVSPGKKARKN